VNVRSSLLASALKRGVDLAGALVLGGPAFVVVVVAGTLVWLRSPGPLLFRSMRETRDGKPFAMLKLRTMVVDAEEQLERALAASPARRDEWVRYRRLTEDPRVVPGVGRVLRQWSVDELPQLWNVLRGEMTLVGPRPLPVDPSSFGPADSERHAVRPGITGYWQVSGGNGLTYREMIKLDLAYLHNWSLWLDIRLLLRTAPALLHRAGPI